MQDAEHKVGVIKLYTSERAHDLALQAQTIFQTFPRTPGGSQLWRAHYQQLEEKITEQPKQENE